MWSDSKDNVVYLAADKHIAYDYAENSEFLDDMDDGEYDKYVENIIVFEIDTDKLQSDLFSDDPNVRNDDKSTFTYAGKIPCNIMKKV